MKRRISTDEALRSTKKCKVLDFSDHWIQISTFLTRDDIISLFQVCSATAKTCRPLWMKTACYNITSLSHLPCQYLPFVHQISLSHSIPLLPPFPPNVPHFCEKHMIYDKF